ALLHTFTNPTPAAGSNFGWSVASAGGNVVVGAPSGISGAAHLFDGTTGALIHSFLSPVQGQEEQFGFAVGGLGPDVVVGAVFNDTGAEDSGTAYVFDGVTGTLRLTLPNPSPASPEYYGWAVAELGGDVLISSIEDQLALGGRGSVHRFDGTTGALLETIHGFPGDRQFGW